MQVLIVDDDPDDLIIFDHILSMMMNYTVTRSSNGLEAVRLASEKHFDLIILDLDLPGLHGIEVARTLRAKEPYRTTPIVFVTAYRPPEQDLAGSEYNLLLQKPIFVASLMEAVSSLLSGPSTNLMHSASR